MLPALLLAAAIVVLNLFTTGATGVGFLVLVPVLCAAWGGPPRR